MGAARHALSLGTARYNVWKSWRHHQGSWRCLCLLGCEIVPGGGVTRSPAKLCQSPEDHLTPLSSALRTNVRSYLVASVYMTCVNLHPDAFCMFARVNALYLGLAMIDNWNFHGSHSHFPSSASGSSLSGRSHLSILSSPSSISSSLSEVHPHSQAPSPSPSFSSGKKTNAFFASPFSGPTSPEPIPPPPLTRSSSVASSSSQPSMRERPDDDNDTTPRLSSAAPPKSAGSLTDSFFRSASPESHPTLPPSMRSLGSAPTSPEPSPPSSPPSASKPRLPPPSRVFPSRVRYTAIDGLPSRQSSLRAQSPLPDAHALQPSGRRHFMDLEEELIMHASPERVSASPLLHPRPQAEENMKSKALNVLIPSPAGASSLPTPISMAQATPPPTGPVPSLKVGDIVTEAPGSGTDSYKADESDGMLNLQLVRTLGQGAFSSVWLARDVSGRIGGLEIVRRSSLKRSLSKSSKGSIRRKKSALRKKVEGAVPKVQLEAGESFGHGERLGSEDSLGGWLSESEQRGRMDGGQGRLVALKMTDRSLCDKDDRTRVSFVREVEVLKVSCTRIYAVLI